MAPPPIQCSAPGCNYSTPGNLPTIADTVTLITLHTQQAHPAPVPQAAHAPVATPKLERLPRPTFTLNMTESKWNFTVLSWNSYIGQSPQAPETTKLMQLRAACDDGLRQRIFRYWQLCHLGHHGPVPGQDEGARCGDNPQIRPLNEPLENDAGA